MKRSIILIILSIIGSRLFAQTPDTGKDTVKLSIGNETITLPMPKEGNKVTVNLEDSTDIIQISIGRMSKTRALNTQNDKQQQKDNMRNRSSHINWFREIELGTVSYLSRNFISTNDSTIGDATSVFSLNTNNVTSMFKITPEKVLPGITFGINIKEKSRPLKNTKMNFITGFKFRYTNFQSKGKYEVVSYRFSINNGVWRYYPDSVVSVKKGDYRASTNFYHMMFPFLVEFGVKDNKFKIATGLNLMVGFSSSRVLANTGENLKSSQIFITYNTPQILMIQPSIRVTHKRFSVQVHTTLNNNTIGYGPTELRTGKLWYLNLGYKLY